VTVELEVLDDSLSLVVGPLDGAAVRTALEDDRDDRISLGRLLDTLVEGVTIESRDDGDWLRLDKRVSALRTRESSNA
jgi:hypothetical protein